MDGVAPEPEAEILANAQREQVNARSSSEAALSARDKRLRRAVRARREMLYNRDWARYIEASRQWSYEYDDSME